MPRLISQCEDRLRDSTGLTVTFAAPLIASAWVDERSGIAGALAATRDWLSDTARFSADWIAGIDALVTQLDAQNGAPC